MSPAACCAAQPCVPGEPLPLTQTFLMPVTLTIEKGAEFPSGRPEILPWKQVFSGRKMAAENWSDPISCTWTIHFANFQKRPMPAPSFTICKFVFNGPLGQSICCTFFLAKSRHFTQVSKVFVSVPSDPVRGRSFGVNLSANERLRSS